MVNTSRYVPSVIRQMTTEPRGQWMLTYIDKCSMNSNCLYWHNFHWSIKLITVRVDLIERDVYYCWKAMSMNECTWHMITVWLSIDRQEKARIFPVSTTRHIYLIWWQANTFNRNSHQWSIMNETNDIQVIFDLSMIMDCIIFE
jgi:hypothetical protein